MLYAGITRGFAHSNYKIERPRFDGRSSLFISLTSITLRHFGYTIIKLFRYPFYLIHIAVSLWTLFDVLADALRPPLARRR